MRRSEGRSPVAALEVGANQDEGDTDLPKFGVEMLDVIEHVTSAFPVCLEQVDIVDFADRRFQIMSLTCADAALTCSRRCCVPVVRPCGRGRHLDDLDADSLFDE